MLKLDTKLDYVAELEKIIFYREHEKRTTVIHTNQCPILERNTKKGTYVNGWEGPFEGYDKVYKHAIEIEEKPTQKIC
jgi:hypothetical protein